MKKIIIFIVLCMLLTPIFAACTPSEYTKGINIDEDYPSDVLGAYDDAVVFESEARFGKVILTMGTKDDLDDIVEYYGDYYEYKGITPSSEEIDDDAYSAVFTADGYEFEIEVSEADGKYIEDLFEYVIEISARALSTDEASSANDSQENVAVQETQSAAEGDDTPVASETDPPTQKNVLDGETSLMSPDMGAWYSYSVYDAGKRDKYVDYTIYFADAATGSYHYLDYGTGEKMDNEFTYEVVNGVLVINLDNNVQLLYDAYYDNNQLHLINQYTDEAMYMKNWQKESGMTPNLNEFTAYGCWIAYPEGFTQPVILAVWEGGSGFVSNWAGDGSSDRMMWKQTGSSLSFEVGMLYGEALTLSHKGNVLHAETETLGTLYFYRATSNVVAGVYEISQTNDGEVGTWEATLNYDGTADHKVSSGRLTFNYDNRDWYINPLDGMLYAFIFGEYASFYYYYNEAELVLHEPTENLDYTFDKKQ